MTSSETRPSWHSTVRALAVSPDACGVLLVPTEDGWRLPQIQIESRASTDLRKAARSLEELLGEPVTILRYASFDEAVTERTLDVTYVLERLSSTLPPAGGRWAMREELDEMSFAAPEQRDEVAHLLRELAEGIRPTERAEWADEGWLDQAKAWIDESLAARGRVRSGHVEQLRAWCLNSVLRMPTAEGAVFFKATAPLPLFADEGAVMEGLARLFPRNVPAPLARDSERCWMLLDDLGPELGWGAPPEVRESVLRLFARMQIESAERIDELLGLGCVDRRLDWLAAEVKMLLDDDAFFDGLDEREVARLRTLGQELDWMFAALAEFSLPATLVHGDLHLSNVARTNGHYVFFDWTDASVTHPFFDLIDVFREESQPLRDRLRDAYLSEWSDVAPMDRLRAAWEVSQPLAFVHHAVSYRNILANVETDASHELRWGTPYFLRKLLAELES
jgi:hypothetical protein